MNDKVASNFQIGGSWWVWLAYKCCCYNAERRRLRHPAAVLSPVATIPCSKSHCPRSSPLVHYDHPIDAGFRTTHTMLIPLSKRNAHKKARLPWCPTRCYQPSFPHRITWTALSMLQTTNHYGSSSKGFHLYLQVYNTCIVLLGAGAWYWLVCKISIVYTLWEHPEALPMFYTVGPVIQKLIDGAGMDGGMLQAILSSRSHVSAW